MIHKELRSGKGGRVRVVLSILAILFATAASAQVMTAGSDDARRSASVSDVEVRLQALIESIRGQKGMTDERVTALTARAEALRNQLNSLQTVQFRTECR